MYCKHCGKEISENAKFCDGCGKSVADEVVQTAPTVLEEPKKKKKKKHPIIGAIVLVLSIFILIGVFGGNDAPQKVENNQADATKNIVETTPAETNPKIFTVGDTMEMHDILVTLNDVSENNGSQFMKPTDGNVYVICEFTIENNTSSEITVSSMMCFEAYFDDYAANISLQAMVVDQSVNQLDGTIAPGKKINGIIGYEAPADWKEMEIRFSPSIFTNNPFIFTYSK